MPTTTPPMIFGPNFVAELIPWMLKMIGDATAHAYRIIWDAAWQVALAHIWLVLGFLALVLLASTMQAFTTGRWGWFGSILYHYFYGGFLILIGFTFGPEVFANDYFDIVLAIMYVVCFLLVRKILKEFGFIRRF